VIAGRTVGRGRAKRMSEAPGPMIWCSVVMGGDVPDPVSHAAETALSANAGSSIRPARTGDVVPSAGETSTGLLGARSTAGVATAARDSTVRWTMSTTWVEPPGSPDGARLDTAAAVGAVAGTRSGSGVRSIAWAVSGNGRRPVEPISGWLRLIKNLPAGARRIWRLTPGNAVSELDAAAAGGRSIRIPGRTRVAVIGRTIAG
jgi:hypothetical protein